ncbi:Rv3212 family protein [Antrihabitans cavernicola]|uniref:Pyrrolo-quinoline quinone repeat domain-containing protein n=1 Tax=Antrihabitans cavernicola TaxID=2495913 RepID=A0A5A7SIE0_9NOCA|nr:PQQ-binding-like beta-propeller repeat protein [Spelaeibacter cavernicola]KAA0024011.1 hypothetical protein FOY51_05395 [Spelaeibacter cavernicola]
MLAPERRSRVDLIVAAALVVAVVVAISVIWLHSDARGTTSVTAETSAVPPKTALTIPDRLREIWRQPSNVTTVPLTAGGAVVTGDDGTVTGRNIEDGKELWHYQRNMPLCGVINSWGTAVAVYRDRRGCSQVTELDGPDGLREAQRTSDADNSIRLSADGTYVVAQGDSRLEVWRSDLVRTLEYGRIDAPVQPKAQPRSGCHYDSARSSNTRVAVLERCPKEAGDRLTLLNPSPKDNQKPEEYGSSVIAGLTPGVDGAQVLAVSGDRVAVYLPPSGNEGPRIGVFDGDANPVQQYALSQPLAADSVVAKNASNYTIWTGSQLIALRMSDFVPIWAAQGVLGPGSMMAGSLLVPIVGGLAVLDPSNGREVRRIDLQRNGSDGKPITQGPIGTAVLGNFVLEQRGDTVVALG